MVFIQSTNQTIILWCRIFLTYGYTRVLPDQKELHSSKSPHLMVIDDLMGECGKSKEMTNLFTRGVHHWGISVVFIVQNIFFSGLRTARINTHYLVLFKNPSDKLQVSTLARQLYPRNSNKFLDAFQDATSIPYSYLLVDLSQNCPDELRLRTNIFPGEITYVYA